MKHTEIFHSENKKLQEMFNGADVANALVEHRVKSTLESEQIAFINKSLFFVVGTQGMDRIDLSVKCGLPGFVNATDDELSWIELDGNKMFITGGNILKNPMLTVIFFNTNVDPLGSSDQVNVLRISGKANLDLDSHKGEIKVRMKVDMVIPNCPRYLPKYELIQDSDYLTREITPEWKKRPYIVDLIKKIEE